MAAYSFIDNINDFFSTGYFTEDFQKKVFDKSGYSQDGIKELCSRFSALRQQYNRYKQAVTSRYAREKDKERETFDFNSNRREWGAAGCSCTYRVQSDGWLTSALCDGYSYTDIFF